jgi:hypothetical protein
MRLFPSSVLWIFVVVVVFVVSVGLAKRISYEKPRNEPVFATTAEKAHFDSVVLGLMPVRIGDFVEYGETWCCVLFGPSDRNPEVSEGTMTLWPGQGKVPFSFNLDEAGHIQKINRVVRSDGEEWKEIALNFFRRKHK